MSSIETALFDLGRAIEYPPTPKFATPTARRRSTLWWAVAAAVVVLALVTTMVPAVRERVAAWLGIRGVTIERTETVDPVDLLPADVKLGEPTSLGEAPVSFKPLRAKLLGDADGVFVDDAGRLTLIYEAGGEIFLLTQFIGDLEPAILKQVGVDAAVEPASVNGEMAIWVGRGPHVVFLLDADGNVTEDRAWIAGPTLLWEVGEITLRLEGAESKWAAIRIAESVASP